MHRNIIVFTFQTDMMLIFTIIFEILYIYNKMFTRDLFIFPNILSSMLTWAGNARALFYHVEKQITRGKNIEQHTIVFLPHDVSRLKMIWTK